MPATAQGASHEFISANLVCSTLKNHCRFPLWILSVPRVIPAHRTFHQLVIRHRSRSTSCLRLSFAFAITSNSSSFRLRIRMRIIKCVNFICAFRLFWLFGWFGVWRNRWAKLTVRKRWAIVQSNQNRKRIPNVSDEERSEPWGGDDERPKEKNSFVFRQNRRRPKPKENFAISFSLFAFVLNGFLSVFV